MITDNLYQKEVIVEVANPGTGVAEKVRPESINNNNITGRVYITGQISSTPEAKAAELTILMDAILQWGVFRDVTEAIKVGVPSGTFVLVSPNDNDLTTNVMVVPAIFGKQEILEEVKANSL